MGTTLLDWTERLATHVREDIRKLGISERRIVKRIGIPRSTLNDLKNAKYTTHGHNPRTLEKLLTAPFWSKETRRAAEVLLAYEDLAFERRVPDTSILDEGYNVYRPGRFAAE
jgi:hypothetical protein